MKYGFWLACIVQLAFAPPAARAWTFPEHARITEIALERFLDPPARAVLVNKVAEARAAAPAPGHLPLCPELIIPIADLSARTDKCVPFSVLPALAGDHAVDTKELRDTLLPQAEPVLEHFAHDVTIKRTHRVEPLANRLSFAVSQRLAEYLAVAPDDTKRLYRNAASSLGRGDESADDQRRMFIRALDLYLRVQDSGYTDRAKGSRAHFQDASAPIEDIIAHATSSGDLNNALAQTLAHHLRSLQLAVWSRAKASASSPVPADRPSHEQCVAEALLEHAQALHFLEDAFAAGHIGTEHEIGGDIQRLRRHDYLNRVGLPVSRVMAQAQCLSAQRQEPSEASDYCWIAYGDGYLDAINADRVAAAAARLSFQLALAFDENLGKSLLEAQPPSDDDAPSCPDESVPAPGAVILLDEDDAISKVDEPSEKVLYEGQYIVHLRTIDLERGAIVRVRAESKEFDAYLNVRLPERQSWPNRDASIVDPSGSTTIEVPEQGTYQIRVGSSTAGQYGRYHLTVEQLQHASHKVRDCTALLRAADQLDPRPTWVLSKSERAERASWTAADREALARKVVRGAIDALAALAKKGQLVAAAAAATSSAQPRAISDEVVGRPLTPCRQSPPWTERQHPLCGVEGTDFRFGEVGASLVRPVLVYWPGPTGDIRTIRGDEAFAAGLAFQVLLGGGVAAGIHPQVPMAFAASFGAGLALRVDHLIPGRMNREVAGINVGLSPLLLVGMDGTPAPGATNPRYVLAGFAEFRMPLISLIGAWFAGVPWSLGRFDIGPTGVRLYVVVPAVVPHDEMKVLGIDVEVLNIKLGDGTSSRSASLGSGTDLELRLRAGTFRPAALDPSFDPGTDWVPMVGIEVASGYSFFIHH